MAISIQEHTFPMTHALELVEQRGDRRHYRTSDGRDYLARPTDNPAYADGHIYWECTYPPEIAHWLTGGIG